MIIDLTEQQVGSLCVWCGEATAVHQTMDREPVCVSCFEDSLRVERALREISREVQRHDND